MQGETEVHVFLSPEVEELLVDNDADLVDLLRREGVEAKRAAPALAAAPEEGKKEPVTVILAASALAVSLTPIVKKLISNLSRRPVLVEERVPLAVEDSQGNVVRNAEGVPVVRWVNRKRFVEATAVPDESSSLAIEGPIGLRISYRSGADAEVEA